MEYAEKTKFKIIIPSLIGVFLFLVPVQYHGESQIVVGILGDLLKSLLGDALVPLLVAVMVVTAVLCVCTKAKLLKFSARFNKFEAMFSPNTFWTVVRVLGAIFAVMTVFKIGPEMIWSDETGGDMLYGIMPMTSVWYIIGGLLLSLLTDYGLLDIFGSFFKKIARPLFCVPGRAIIDCVTSWLGSSVVGTYLTVSQYNTGFYTGREAAIIISNFSLLSVSFCSLIASMVGMESRFGAFYLTICIASIACAVILPRLWPLKVIPNTYNPVTGKQVDESNNTGLSSLEWGYQQALARVRKAPGPKEFLVKGLFNVLNLIVTALPAMMTFGTIALIIANYTPVFDFLGMPIGLYLQLFNVPEAFKTGSAILVGFVDQYIPVIIGSTMAEPLTRFMLGTMSIIQIIYITDIGSLILTSKMPFNLWQMFVVFLERVLISIPIVVMCAHLFQIA